MYMCALTLNTIISTNSLQNPFNCFRYRCAVVTLEVIYGFAENRLGSISTSLD